MHIRERRFVTLHIDNDYVKVCDRLHWVMERWGPHNFTSILPTKWDYPSRVMIVEFWVDLHPVDATQAMDEIWQAVQNKLDINGLPPVPQGYLKG